MDSKSIIIVGASGMIGGLSLQGCLAAEEVSAATVLVRRSLGVSHPKLREVVHTDYADYSALVDTLAGQDAALFCLGAYTGSVRDDEFRKITVDYAVNFAKALHDASPQAAFCFLSGAGADQTERSRMSFARYKGAAEKALLGVGFPRVHIFRPAYIYPVEKRIEPNFSYRLMRVLWPLVRAVYPNAGVASDALAKAMVQAALHGTPEYNDPVIENRDIRAMSAG
ncbi:MAG: hypothetical protein KDB68_17325 [Planctomycetes bacterium]|nr:hypothetical protein [Planctomycetota bacterium]